METALELPQVFNQCSRIVFASLLPALFAFAPKQINKIEIENS